MLVEAAVGDHQAVLIDGIRLARIAGAAKLQDAREFLFRSDAKGQGGDDLKVSVANRRSDDHGGDAGTETAKFILRRSHARKRWANRDLAGQSFSKERFVLWKTLVEKLRTGRS